MVPTLDLAYSRAWRVGRIWSQSANQTVLFVPEILVVGGPSFLVPSSWIRARFRGKRVLHVYMAVVVLPRAFGIEQERSFLAAVRCWDDLKPDA